MDNEIAICKAYKESKKGLEFLMKSSYKKTDVELLLTDLTNKVNPIAIEEKKQMEIQGLDVKNIVTDEFPINKKYFDICFETTPIYAKQTAIAVGNLAEQIYNIKKENLVLVSILRAGTLVGILVKRYLKNKYNIDVFHYSISLPKDVKQNEMKFILNKHKAQDIIFIDSWTGKGTTTNKIREFAKQIDGLGTDLAVLSDAINISRFCGIREDIAIPQAPFNACITGLVGAPITDSKYLNDEDFSGSIYLKNLEKFDVTNWYINLIEQNFDYKLCNNENYEENPTSNEELSEICLKYKIELKDLNPGINEAGRALLRRNLKKLLVKDKNDIQIMQIKKIAELKGIEVEEYNFKYYRAAAIAYSE